MVSASEVAYFSLSPTDIEHLEKEGGPANNRIIDLKKKPRRLLVSILVANNFINIGIVILSYYIMNTLISENTFNEWAQALSQSSLFNLVSVGSLASILSFALTTVVATFILVLFGEVAPKIYANLNNIRHARMMSGPLVILTSLLSPFSGVLVGWSNKIEESIYRKRLTKSPDRKDIDKAIELSVSHEESQEDVDILKGIIKFGDVEAKQIMKPRIDVVSIEKDTDFKGVMKIIKECGFSRIPIYTDDFDNIEGMLYVKDLLGFTHKKDFNWQKIVRTNVLYVPESKKIDQLLKVFQKKRTHIAVVVDEYGGSSGIITLEDIMEEVVGEIKDEFDIDDEVEYLKIDDHNYIFEGKTLLNDVARVLGLEASIFDEGRGSADSLAGLVIELMGKIPKPDREIVYGELKFRIVAASKKRIEKINVCL